MRRKNSRNCHWPNCKTTLCAFTPRDDTQRRAWLDVLQLVKADIRSNCKTVYICSQHFSEQSFVNLLQHRMVGSRLRLVTGAVPSVAPAGPATPLTVTVSEPELSSRLHQVTTSEDIAETRVNKPEACNRELTSQMLTSVPQNQEEVVILPSDISPAVKCICEAFKCEVAHVDGKSIFLHVRSLCKIFVNGNYDSARLKNQVYKLNMDYFTETRCNGLQISIKLFLAIILTGSAMYAMYNSAREKLLASIIVLLIEGVWYDLGEVPDEGLENMQAVIHSVEIEQAFKSEEYSASPISSNDGLASPISSNDGLVSPVQSNDGLDSPVQSNDGLDSSDRLNVNQDSPTQATIIASYNNIKEEPVDVPGNIEVDAFIGLAEIFEANSEDELISPPPFDHALYCKKLTYTRTADRKRKRRIVKKKDKNTKQFVSLHPSEPRVLLSPLSNSNLTYPDISSSEPDSTDEYFAYVNQKSSTLPEESSDTDWESPDVKDDYSDSDYSPSDEQIPSNEDTIITYSDKTLVCQICNVKRRVIKNVKPECAVCEEHHKIIPEKNEIMYECPECDKLFWRGHVKAYIIHVKHIHRNEPSPFTCSFCQESFLILGDLKRHEKIHTNTKDFICEVCGRGFTQHENLKGHMRQHTGEKPFKCEHCGKDFCHNISLRTHKCEVLGRRLQDPKEKKVGIGRRAKKPKKS